MLNIPAAVTEPGKWLANEKNKFVISWKKENSRLSPKEASEMGLSLSVQQENRVMIMYENERYITLAYYNYTFSGGAHGNYGTALSTLDKRGGRKLQLSDVVSAAGIKALPAVLEQVARLQYG
jgi:Deacetylase PdaC